LKAAEIFRMIRMSRTSIAKAGLLRWELALEIVPAGETVEEIVAVEDVRAEAVADEVVDAEVAAAVVVDDTVAGMAVTVEAAADGTNFVAADSRGLRGLKPLF
jgi:hypothetical protein